MKRRERLPSPSDVARDIQAVRAAISGSAGLESLEDEYRWAYNASLQPSIGEGSKSGPTIGADGSVPGSTAATAAGKEWMRKKLASAAERISRLRSDAMAARDDIESAMRTLTPRDIPPTGVFPRTVSKAELEQSQEAQDRRTRSGRGWGES